MRRTMRSTVHFVASVDDVLFGMSVGVSEKFSFLVGCVPEVGACVKRCIATVFGTLCS